MKEGISAHRPKAWRSLCPTKAIIKIETAMITMLTVAGILGLTTCMIWAAINVLRTVQPIMVMMLNTAPNLTI
jgi:hypothetical protein